MLRAFSTAATGMSAQQMMVDTIANNLANINTVGFKRGMLDFEDLMYVKSRTGGEVTDTGATAPTGFEIGSGVRAASTLKVFTPGEPDNTGNPLDVMIQGAGFFQVTVGGEVRYTRDGSFRLSADGALVTKDGYTVDGTSNIPQNARTISIGKDGTISVMAGNDEATTNAGRITVVRFANPSGLSSEGGNLYSATEASGSAVSGTGGQDGVGSIQQGFLERSNVQMVTELVNLIKAQRAYEINSRAIRAGDDMLQTANQLVR